MSQVGSLIQLLAALQDVNVSIREETNIKNHHNRIEMYALILMVTRGVGGCLVVAPAVNVECVSWWLFNCIKSLNRHSLCSCYKMTFKKSRCKPDCNAKPLKKYCTVHDCSGRRCWLLHGAIRHSVCIPFDYKTSKQDIPRREDDFKTCSVCCNEI